MNELEIANRTIDTLYICAYVGFALWGIAGWYVGRFFLRKLYIKPTGLINMKVVRQIENDNQRLSALIKERTMEKDDLFLDVQELTDHNKRLWYWSYQPHRDTEFVTITQLDKNGEEVACSQSNLPPREHWVEPMYYVDDTYESYDAWKKTLPHNQDPKTHTNFML